MHRYICLLTLDNVHFSYEDKTILDGVSFSVKKGEIIALIGISGSGKTTLFRLINGFLSPQKGTIQCACEHVTCMRQEDFLLPWRTVLENLLLFAELGKKSTVTAALIQQAYYLLQRVGLAGYAEAFPQELSGGMKQRVSLARALLQGHPLLLLDEPFASLDVIFREQLYKLLREIRDQYQKTIVMVTHDFRDAISLADRLLVLSHGTIVSSYQLSPEMRHDYERCEALIQEVRSSLLSTLSQEASLPSPQIA